MRRGRSSLALVLAALAAGFAWGGGRAQEASRAPPRLPRPSRRPLRPQHCGCDGWNTFDNGFLERAYKDLTGRDAVIG